MGHGGGAVEAGAVTYRVPTKREAEIMERNGLNTDEFAVCRAGEDYLHLLCYRTRDELILHRGDLKWPEEQDKRDERNELR